MKDFYGFYHMALLPGALPPETEGAVLEYILNHPKGMYYICPGPINRLPERFKSREASRWLGAIEILARFPRARNHLKFALDWILMNKDIDGEGWDMGAEARDGIYFPLSDSWRNPSDRRLDCSHRVRALIDVLECDKSR
ncbi:MAG: hypothetical protein LBS19_10795 [Clostridiales bacterium]|jgi:hypothetical protein|nr:hypothetical protein [Clostridiales bacterium]